MRLARTINELLTGEGEPAQKQGIWQTILRNVPRGLVGLKIILAITVLAEVIPANGMLGEALAQISAAIAAKIGKGVPPYTTTVALAAIVLLHDGATRAMSIAHKALTLAIKPLLNERHQAGLSEGHQAGLSEGHQAGLSEGHQAGLSEGRAEERAEWQQWLRRRNEAEAQGRLFDEPPPGEGRQPAPR